MDKKEFEKKQWEINRQISKLYKEREKLEEQYLEDNSILKRNDYVTIDGYPYIINSSWYTAAGIRYEACELTKRGNRRKITWNYDPTVKFFEREMENKNIKKVA